MDENGTKYLFWQPPRLNIYIRIEETIAGDMLSEVLNKGRYPDRYLSLGTVIISIPGVSSNYALIHQIKKFSCS